MADGMFYTLGLKTAGFTGPLRGASGLIGRFRGNIARMATGLPALAGGLLGVAGAAGALKKAITSAADMESMEVAFATMIGDSQRAKQLLEELRDFGANTPFELPGLATATRQLLTGQVAVENLLPTLRMIGDVASGTNTPIEEMARAFAKAANRGKVTNEILDLFTDRGVPILKLLADQLGVTADEIFDMASKGQIGFANLQAAMRSLTVEGGMFHNMMQKQSATTNGLLSTLKDNIAEVFRIIGKPTNDFLKPILERNIERVKRLGTGLQLVFDTLRAAKANGNLGQVIGAGLQLAVVRGVNTLSGGIQGVVAYMATTIPAIFSSLGKALDVSRVMVPIRSTFRGIGAMLKADFVEAVSYLPGLGDLADQAAQMRAGGEADLKAAAIQFSKIDLGAGLQTAIDGIRDAHVDGARAAAIAFQGAASLIDEGPSRAKARVAVANAGGEALRKRWEDFFNTRPAAEATKKAGDAIEKGGQDLRAALGKAGRDVAAGALPALGGGAANEGSEGRRRSRLLNAEESFLARSGRRSRADRDKDILDRSPSERLKLQDFFRRRAGMSRLGGGIMDADRIRNLLPAAAARIADRARGEAGRIGAPREPRDPERGTVDALSRTERLLASIDGRLAALEATS